MILSICLLCICVLGHKVVGPIELNGETYQAECTCQPSEASQIADVKCHPNAVKITQDKEGEGADLEEMYATYGNADEFTYV